MHTSAYELPRIYKGKVRTHRRWDYLEFIRIPLDNE
jgi:hypothetical protein